MMLRTGGCRCRANRYEVAGPPVAGIACHCRDCQYAAGGGPNLTMVFGATGFRVAEGITHVFKAKPSSGGAHFCAACGVQVFSIPDSNPDLVAVKVGGLDDASDFRVDADIWMASAPAWHRPHDGAAQFPGNPEF